MTLIWWIIGATVLLFFLSGLRQIRPTHRGLVETFGKYTRTGGPGLNWIFPFVQTLRYVNMTERMADVEPQMIQTSDKLNTRVDVVVYYKIVDPIKAAYNVDDHRAQLVKLAQTTLRAVLGKKTLTEAIGARAEINKAVETILDKETKSYGVDVLRVEVQRIDPPKDVQQAMNEVVKAENEKISAVNRATAAETEADGERRSDIKRAQGRAQAIELKAKADATAVKLEAEADARAIEMRADARAKAIKVVNESAEKYFKGNARLLKKLEVTQASLQDNTKFVVTEKGISPTLVLNETGDKVIPTAKRRST